MSQAVISMSGKDMNFPKKDNSMHRRDA